MPEVKFARTQIMVDNEIVAKVTSFNRDVAIAEEDITGSEDYIAGTNVLHQQFASISVGETAAVEGIAIESAAAGLDDGQSELRDSAETGAMVTMRHVRHTGYGYVLTGFFTAYSENGNTGEVYKYKGTFRVNSKVAITPGS
ncbi:MAG: hypothetical protein A2Z35_05950 [Actinobacteria bacterium RBG_19FT_COMBO_36_27]|jgi:hypothetical protein|nr:MAG: hypothetical protein A2Z35_05950 [Actinobacteria bacterium RBG_19FT_COMBO_36_27]